MHLHTHACLHACLAEPQPAGLQPAAPHVAAVAGPWATQDLAPWGPPLPPAALLAAALAAGTGATPDCVRGAAVLYDLLRLFDGIPRLVLVNHARAIGYPMTCLRVALV